MPGKTTTVAVNLPSGSISINAQPWAEVWIAGERVGETPIANISRRVGSYEIVLRHPQLGERRENCAGDAPAAGAPRRGYARETAVKQLWPTVMSFACASLVSASLAYGQGTLQQVKALYASAAYEDALSVVTQLLSTSRNVEFEQYRVFCLVALGRTAEAEKAITSVVVENPSFVPDARETSPRIQGMFQRIRRELVPEIAQRMYLEARAALDQKDKAAASSQFAALVSLIDSAAESERDGEPAADSAEPMLSELRLLASGFLDLSRAMSEAKPRDRTRAGETTPVPVRSPRLPVTSAVPVKQDLPVWVPPDQASRREFRGTLRVFVSDTGRVTGAELASTIHPAYDRQLLQAAKSWEYQPALKNGTPVPSEKVIEVVLKPR